MEAQADNIAENNELKKIPYYVSHLRFTVSINFASHKKFSSVLLIYTYILIYCIFI